MPLVATCHKQEGTREAYGEVDEEVEHGYHGHESGHGEVEESDRPHEEDGRSYARCKDFFSAQKGDGGAESDDRRRDDD